MNENMSMAVVMTCYNRKDKTVRCINSLNKAAQRVPGLDIFFYIWDDGSNDGTVTALNALEGKIRIFTGPGGYFWSKSMNAVMKEAIKQNHSLYLMVNDDVRFYEDCLKIMTDSYELSGGNCAIVGSSRFNGEFTYGGRDYKYDGIIPSGDIVECRYADWNCFMIDKYVLSKVGVICGKYEHAWGDYDYSGRMYRMGIPQYIAADYVGECEDDHAISDYLNPDYNLRERLKNLFAPKGEPIYSYFRFHWVDRRFKGIMIASYSYLLLLIRVLSVGRKAQNPK